MANAHMVQRDRPADGNQKYLSDFPEITAVLFSHFMESKQRKGEAVAVLEVTTPTGQAKTVYLTLEHPNDIEFFEKKLAEKSKISIKYNGNPKDRRLIVWFRGKRVDLNTDLIGYDDTLPPEVMPASASSNDTIAALAKRYGRAFEAAEALRLELDDKGTRGFDTNLAAAAILQALVTARVAGKVSE
jgi:hypothetical protein